MQIRANRGKQRQHRLAPGRQHWSLRHQEAIRRDQPDLGQAAWQVAVRGNWQLLEDTLGRCQPPSLADSTHDNNNHA